MTLAFLYARRFGVSYKLLTDLFDNLLQSLKQSERLTDRITDLSELYSLNSFKYFLPLFVVFFLNNISMIHFFHIRVRHEPRFLRKLQMQLTWIPNFPASGGNFRFSADRYSAHRCHASQMSRNERVAQIIVFHYQLSKTDHTGGVCVKINLTFKDGKVSGLYAIKRHFDVALG